MGGRGCWARRLEKHKGWGPRDCCHPGRPAQGQSQCGCRPLISSTITRGHRSAFPQLQHLRHTWAQTQSRAHKDKVSFMTHCDFEPSGSVTRNTGLGSSLPLPTGSRTDTTFLRWGKTLISLFLGRRETSGGGPKRGWIQNTSRNLERLGSSWCQFLIMSKFTSKVLLSTVRLSSQDRVSVLAHKQLRTEFPPFTAGELEPGRRWR